MHMETIVESGSIAEVGFDKETNILRIRFVHGGLYEYPDTSPQLHQDFMAAKSKGSFFQLNIRSRKCTRVEEPKEAGVASGN